MAQITISRQKQIKTTLDETYFGSAAFNVTFPDDTATFVKVEFADNSDFHFHVSRSYAGTITVTYSPGDLTVATERDVKEFNDVLQALRKWAGLVREELTASSPVYDEVERLKQEFTEKLNAHAMDSRQHFSQEEADELETKLDELAGKLEELSNQQALTWHELKAAKELIAQLQSDLTTVPKKTWYRSAGNKLIELANKTLSTEAGQKLLGKAVDKLLGPS